MSTYCAHAARPGVAAPEKARDTSNPRAPSRRDWLAFIARLLAR
jgi:hypothetical protein